MHVTLLHNAELVESGFDWEPIVIFVRYYHLAAAEFISPRISGENAVIDQCKWMRF